MRRLSLALVLAVLALVAGASPALAHTRLISSTPAEGALVTAAPEAIKLTFTDPMQAKLSTVTVSGPSGARWGLGEITAQDGTLTVPVQTTGPAGDYVVEYRVLSGDGHPVKGAVRFTYTPPPVAGTESVPPTAPSAAETSASSAAAVPEQAPAAQRAPAESGGVPVWVWIAGAAVLLALGLLAARRFSGDSGRE
ncbi:copper resistance CopC family protein [Actinokineospora iranica]|uniref:CopC domain-containing protein n=1 Tax=Actinokineospora iranica TaxID=1271860 RepID=A0A1G6XBZ3_9PSEU|nr:copper resistance CopC family protein [Actinokineospora iranica]SDD75660.1 hypothetical protein SAMN05216174_11724 [Actinokineospora iranica]